MPFRRCDIRIYPTQGTAIVLLSNNAQADDHTLMKNLGRIYLGDKMSAPQATQLSNIEVVQSFH